MRKRLRNKSKVKGANRSPICRRNKCVETVSSASSYFMRHWRERNKENKERESTMISNWVIFHAPPKRKEQGETEHCDLRQSPISCAKEEGTRRDRALWSGTGSFFMRHQRERSKENKEKAVHYDLKQSYILCADIKKRERKTRRDRALWSTSFKTIKWCTPITDLKGSTIFICCVVVDICYCK